MVTNKAIKIIDNWLGPITANTLLEGQPEGCSSDWGYDNQLILDIAKACENCEKRTNY